MYIYIYTYIYICVYAHIIKYTSLAYHLPYLKTSREGNDMVLQMSLSTALHCN